MKIRFIQPVRITGGPQYGPGDVVETDERFVTVERAEAIIRHGWAVAVDAVPVVPATAEATPKAPATPPKHKAVLAREQVAAKSE